MKKTEKDCPTHHTFHPQGLVALLGNPVSHSLSPLMHNMAFEKVGLNWVYHAFEVQSHKLGPAIEGLKALNFKGGNITAPYKMDVLHYMDQLSEEAEAAGAVNTLIMENGRIIGDNTDGEGFVKSIELEKSFDLNKKKALVLGAGGASRGVCLSLAKRNLKGLYIANRTKSKAKTLVDIISRYQPTSTMDLGALSIDEEILSSKTLAFDVIINTLPLDPPKYLLESFTNRWKGNNAFKYANSKLFADLRYGEKKGKYLDQLMHMGITTVDGSGMLLYQGALAFEKWTHIDPPIDVMKMAFA